MFRPNDDLQGFVLLENPSKETILLNIGNIVLVNKAGLHAISDPMYVNIFFDECGKRLMIRKADKKCDNIFRVTKSGISDYTLIKSTILRIIEKENFPERTVISYLGHRVKDSDCLIFDLSTIHMVRRFPRSSEK